MPHPTLCLCCGNDRPAAQPLPCPGCQSLPPAVTWTREALTPSVLGKRALSAVGMLLLSAVLLLTALSLVHSWVFTGPIGQTLQVLIAIVVVPVALVMAGLLTWQSLIDTVSRTDRWESLDGRQRGSVTTAFGRFEKADCTATRVAQKHTVRGEAVSAQSVYHANLRGVRKALCTETMTAWRNPEVLALSALSGMLHRGEVTLRFVGDQSWRRNLAQVVPVMGGPAVPMLSASASMAPAGWLERQIFGALPRGDVGAPRTDEDTLAASPFRTPARVEPRTEGDERPLEECLREAFSSLPDLQKGLLERVRDDRASYVPMDAAQALTRLLATLQSDAVKGFAVGWTVRRAVEAAGRRVLRA